MFSAADNDAFTADLLASDLVVSPPADVTEMFDCYNNTLRQLVNQHVPVITITMTNYWRSTSPWFDSDCHLTKAKTRRFEKIYRRKGTCASEWDWREQYQKQRHLYSSKFASYWSNKIDSCGDNNKSLWTRLRSLLHPSDSASFQHSADDFAHNFINKVDQIRASTANAPVPIITARSVSQPLSCFEPVTSDEVLALLKKSPAKQCSLDQIPTWLTKQLSSVFAPVIANLCNKSFDQRTLPTDQKRAITHPFLKKPSLDANDFNNNRPLSNLSFLSKTIERLAMPALSSMLIKTH